MALPPWGVDEGSFKPAARAATRAPDRSDPRAKPQMLAHTVLQKQRQQQRTHQPHQANDSWEQKPYAAHLENARARQSAGSMIARKVLDKQRAGQISARRAQDPNWDAQRNAAFAYADQLDQQGAQQGAAVRQAGNSLKSSLTVDTKRSARGRHAAPVSPAERIKHARGPRADVHAAHTLDTARVEELWEFSGDFFPSQFEGEKPGYVYNLSGARGQGYYAEGAQEAPKSPAQRITSFKSSFADRARGAVARSSAVPVNRSAAVSSNRSAAPVPGIQGRSSTMISPIKTSSFGAKKVRPSSAHPTTGSSRHTRPDVPSLQLGGKAVKPAGVQGLGLNQPRARPRSAAVSRVASKAAGAWRSNQARGGGTTNLW
eukprot:TRINITY_DN1725_c0_g1_i1.p1 TRINITY_DN1725_c0_g1~~TRINITY_DN1725_c0_g1_i1.p1  ORF type:complete len:373 (+),score=53.48 TRINITY_DN1725_c0_g1_i1:39-1157(+)